MTSGLVLSLAFGVPLLIALLTAIAWDLWSRPAEPPRFAAYTVRQGWKIDPIALLDQDLRLGRLTGAIFAVHDRLVRELTERHGLRPAEILRDILPLQQRRDPTIDRACRSVRALEVTYQIANRVEDPRRTDVWSQWRRPVWRSSARRRFQAELSEIESIWPVLEGLP